MDKKTDNTAVEIEAIGKIINAIKELPRSNALRALKYAEEYADDEILPEPARPA